MLMPTLLALFRVSISVCPKHLTATNIRLEPRTLADTPNLSTSL